MGGITPYPWLCDLERALCDKYTHAVSVEREPLGRQLLALDVEVHTA